MDTLTDFIVQMAVGTDVALFRVHNIGYDRDCQTVRNLKLRRVAEYLNRCFVSIIRRDDPYIVETFDKIFAVNTESNGFTVRESPLCLFSTMFELYQKVLVPAPRPVIGFSCEPDNTDEYIDLLNTILGTHYEPFVKRALEKWRVVAEAHDCQNTPYSEIAKMDPSQPFFKINPECSHSKQET